MWNRLIDSPVVYVLLFGGVILSTALGFYVGNRFLLPVLNVCVSYPVLFSLLARERRKRAIGVMIFWAICMAVVTVTATVQYPQRAAESILNGPSYMQEMFHWIRTGEGSEGNPARFVPVHLLHLIIFVVLSALTASTLSLTMGAVLMNYMSFYVGSLIRASSDPVLATWMGWHPWSIIRVVSYVILGVLLAEPGICKFVRRDYDFVGVRPFLWIALAGLGLDILLKAFLAPWWGLVLRTILGGQ